MEENSIFNLYKKEQEVFAQLKKEKPELFLSSKIPEKKILSQIGIKYEFPQRQRGYFRLYPQDFIVEEISESGEIFQIEPKETKIHPPKSSSGTIYATLVKVGISTFNAISQLASFLKIPVNRIGYAGLKDIKAITSQRIAIPNINLENFLRIKNSSFSNFFLTDFSFGKGTIAPGQLLGNRFTIFIRTEKEIEKKQISERIREIEEKGFLNFYGPQRFGTPRLLAHHFGKLILQERYKEAIFAFLFEPGLKGIPLINQIRKEAEKLAPNWQEIEEKFKKFPYTFREELRLLAFLKKNPSNFIGALIFLKDQITLWVYAYASYLFNLLLSSEKEIKLPPEIPLLLSDNPKDWEIYKFWLKEDQIENFQKAISPFRFILLKRRFVKTRVFPQKIQFKILPEGIILSFILEKGIYATTLLMNIFELETGEPIPEWVSFKEIDAKKELGIGSIKKIKEILGKKIFTFQVLSENMDF